ncbi:MAG: HAMP domain-containing protein [Chloroflexi bacterium]|nr:HAMP domain-containing protein [Chloroflexota bacterium]
MNRLRRIWRGLRTIRVRLTLWYVGLLAVILLGFSTFLFFNLSRNLYDELDRSLVSYARQLVGNLVVVGGSPRFGDEVELLPPGTVAVLYDRSGRQLIANAARQPLLAVVEGLVQATREEQRFNTVRVTDGPDWRVLTVPVVRGGRMVAVIQVARSTQEIVTALGQLVALMAVAVPLTLLLAIAGGLFLAGRALGPIDRMTRAAGQMSAEDLSRRIEIPPSHDEVGRLAATFDRMLDRLEAAFRRQRQFTADASHELRTPLAALAGEVDVLLERDRTGQEYREGLASVRRTTSRMSQLVSDLLTLARADARDVPLVREPLDLGILASEVAATLAPLAEARRLDLRYEAGSGPIIEGDQTRLTQLLVNLVDNGLKYTSPGGIVRVSVGREDGYGVVRVADNGVGIASEHIPHLFERFYRADKARSRADGGTGLGLAISRWIAEVHGGTIDVESAPGQGSTFSVRLPLKRSQGA